MKYFAELNRSTWVLSLALALAITGQLILFSVSSLAAIEMGASLSQATLPYFFGFLGALLTTLPFSLAMSRRGRKPWFVIAALTAALSAIIMAWGYALGSLFLFFVGQTLFGLQMASGFFYRFAVLESAAKGQEQKSLGFLFFSGVFAAFLGPNLAQWSHGWEGQGYLGSYFLMTLLYLIVAGVLSLLPLNIPPKVLLPVPVPRHGGALRAPGFLQALIAGMSSYAVMTLLMGVTPMAMQQEQFAFSAVTLVIQWHMLGMFLPGLLTGRLLEKWGAGPLLTLGGFMYLGCFGLGFGEQSFWLFWGELFLLGLGWNVSYLAATSLLQRSLRPGEAGLGQGLNEMAILSVNALVLLTSGQLIALLGWGHLHWFILPLVVPLLVVGLQSQKKEKKGWAR